MSDEIKPKMTLAAQLQVQQMYNNQIKGAKSEKQLVEDELIKTKRKLRQVTKKPLIINEPQNQDM